MMLNLQYSYWNKSLSTVIHHGMVFPSNLENTPLKKKKKKEVTSAVINHRFLEQSLMFMI